MLRLSDIKDNFLIKPNYYRVALTYYISIYFTIVLVVLLFSMGSVAIGAEEQKEGKIVPEMYIKGQHLSDPSWPCPIFNYGFILNP
jgi:hypothetical protein